jgi:O-antigen ligase
MLGASRGGFLGLTLAALFIVARSPQPLKKLVAIVAICLPISLAVPQSPVRRLMNPTYSDDDAVQARRVAWKAGQRMIETHPIVGVGLGNFRDLSASYEDPDEIVISIAHNTYIELAAELGIPGLLLFLGVEVASFISLEKSRKMARRLGDQFLQNVATGLQAGLLGNALALCFVSGQVQKLYWLVIFLGTCLPALLARAKVKKQMMDLKTVKGGAVLLERQAVKGLA